MIIAVYHTQTECDPLICAELIDAGCGIYCTHSIAETMDALVAAAGSAAAGSAALNLLVAEVQAGGIALLELLLERFGSVPPTLLVDLEQTGARVPVLALKHGCNYVSVNDTADPRRLESQPALPGHRRQLCAPQPSGGGFVRRSAHPSRPACAARHLGGELPRRRRRQDHGRPVATGLPAPPATWAADFRIVCVRGQGYRMK